MRNATSTPLDVFSAASVLAPVWMPMCLPSSFAASAEISSSSTGSTRGSSSITFTFEPKRAKTEANSMPTAPAPITIRLRGMSFSSRISSEVTMDLPSGVMPGRLRGREPVARITALVVSLVSALSPWTTTVRGPSSRPVPLKSAILFFLNR